MWKRRVLMLAMFSLAVGVGAGFGDVAWAAEAESVATFDASESGDEIGMIQLALVAVCVVTLGLLVGYLRHTSPRRGRRSESNGTV